MKVGDLVKHKLSGVGVIIDINSDYRVAPHFGVTPYGVMYASGSFFWSNPRLLEVISESR